jgi:hypothetical protein
VAEMDLGDIAERPSAAAHLNVELIDQIRANASVVVPAGQAGNLLRSLMHSVGTSLIAFASPFMAIEMTRAGLPVWEILPVTVVGMIMIVQLTTTGTRGISLLNFKSSSKPASRE